MNYTSSQKLHPTAKAQQLAQADVLRKRGTYNQVKKPPTGNTGYSRAPVSHETRSGGMRSGLGNYPPTSPGLTDNM